MVPDEDASGFKVKIMRRVRFARERSALIRPIRQGPISAFLFFFLAGAGRLWRFHLGSLTFYARYRDWVAVGSDGSSADVVVKQWSKQVTTVFTLTAANPGYHITETETGPFNVNIDHYNSIITNAAEGVLYSWQARESCAANSEVGNRRNR
jgi:hypothetical protein